MQLFYKSNDFIFLSLQFLLKSVINRSLKLIFIQQYRWRNEKNEVVFEIKYQLMQLFFIPFRLMSVITNKIRKNMKKVILAAIALIVSALTMSVSAAVLHDRDDVHEDRNVKNFHKVVVEGGYDVHYLQGNTVSVRLVGDKKEINRVLVSSDGATLKISRNKRTSGLFSFKDDDLDIYITSPDLTSVIVKGSGDFKSQGKIDSDNLSLTVLGSGDISLYNVICDNLYAKMSGSGDVEIKQLRCSGAKYELVGSGDISVRQSNVRATDISLKGSGEFKGYLKDCGKVKCNLVGSGDIRLSGTAVSWEQTKLGTGTINTTQLRVNR